MKRHLLNHPKIALFCLGCLAAMAMAPVYAWPLLFVGYGGLMAFLLRSTSWKQAGLHSFLFFFGYFICSLYWTSASLFVEFDVWWWALPFSFAGLPFLLALFPALTCIAAFFIKKGRFFAFLAALILADYARGTLFTGFPWNLPVHTWTHTPFMMSLLPFIGFWALNAITILTITLTAAFFMRQARYIYLPITILSLALLPAITQAKNSISLPDIVMVQTNIPQKEKWNPDLVWRNFNRYIDSSQTAVAPYKDALYVMWPETAISERLLSYPDIQRTFENFLEGLPKGSLLITGYLRYDNGGAFYNSLAIFDRAGQIVALYDKHHLVPFGEYMPLGLDTITGFNGFSAGRRPAPINLGDASILPLICYEIIFPKYSAYSEADFILNITNDSWFGRTAGPYQHFDHARFRAAENGIPVLRISGNGISGAIASDGAVTKALPLNTTGLMHIFDIQL